MTTTQKESKRKVPVWTHDEILSSHQNYKTTSHHEHSKPFCKFNSCFKGLFPSQIEPLPKQRFYFHRLFVTLEQVPLLKTAIASLVLAVLAHYFCVGVLRGRFFLRLSSQTCLRMRQNNLKSKYPFRPASQTSPNRRAACSLVMLLSVTRNKIL